MKLCIVETLNPAVHRQPQNDWSYTVILNTGCSGLRDSKFAADFN